MKTKALISFAVTVKLICAFVFAYAKKKWFSYYMAYIFFRLADYHLVHLLWQEVVLMEMALRLGDLQRDTKGITSIGDPSAGVLESVS